MPTKIQKWGISLALRIPKAFAEEAGLSSETPVEIGVVDGQIRIIPVRWLMSRNAAMRSGYGSTPRQVIALDGYL